MAKGFNDQRPFIMGLNADTWSHSAYIFISGEYGNYVCTQSTLKIILKIVTRSGRVNVCDDVENVYHGLLYFMKKSFYFIGW